MGKKENTAIVVNGFAENKTDDQILQQLFEEGGVDFGDMRTVFNEIVEQKELRLTPKQRAAKTETLMDGVTKIETVEELTKTVAMLETKLKTTNAKALGSLRTWAKGLNIELPKAPRVVKARKVGYGGHYAKILDHILAEREAGNEFDKKSINAFCHANGIPEAYSTQALNVVHFAKRWNGEIVDAAPEAESK